MLLAVHFMRRMSFAKRIHEDRESCRFMHEKHLAISNWHLARLKPALASCSRAGFSWVDCQMPTANCWLRPPSSRRGLNAASSFDTNSTFSSNFHLTFDPV